jgi:hypothetical protein
MDDRTHGALILSEALSVEALRVALASWQELKIYWLQGANRRRSPEMEEHRDRALAKCDSEIERLERLIASHGADEKHVTPT